MTAQLTNSDGGAPALNVCCGEQSAGVAGQPIVSACQLCPLSPTHHGTTETSFHLTPEQANSAVCLTCRESTTNRDRYEAPRCESCCAWLGVA